jgi:type IX secretion system PorP/SprF family membrane protein
MRVLEGKLPGNDLLGVGLLLMNDKAGDGQLSNLSLMGSAAYHKVFGSASNHNVSLGVQLAYTQRSIDESELVFPNQFDVDEFNQDILSNENISDNLGYPDLNAGLLYSIRQSEKFSAFAGFSFYHIIRPTETFLSGDNKLSNRLTVHGGTKYSFSPQLAITPNVIVMMQNGAREINVGTGLEYDMAKTPEQQSAILGLGLWYRMNDAVIVVPTVEYKSFRLGLSYDINISDLSNASNGKGGFEISLIYLGCIPKGPTRPMYVPCPRL